MKLHHVLAAAMLVSSSTFAFAHPGGHDDEQPSADECAQFKKLSKADAEKPAMKELKQKCDAASPDAVVKPAEHKHQH